MSTEALSDYGLDNWQTAAARQAFRSGSWSRNAPRERIAVMYRFAELIEQDTGRLAVLDIGKPVSDLTRPVGACKQAGHARDRCVESLLNCTQGKSAWIRLSA